MTTNAPILTVHQPCDMAVTWMVGQLKQAGLSVLRTFDLQLARSAQAACPCPYHGTESCDCQMVVLLVYPAGGSPVTLIGHGDDSTTVFSLVDTPQQKVDPQLEAVIQDCFIHSSW